MPNSFDAIKYVGLNTARDAGISTLKGAIGLGESAVGLANLVTPGIDIGGLAKKYAGYDPQKSKEQLDKYYSPAQKEAVGKVEKAKGFGATAVSLAKNPSTIANALFETAPYLLGGAGAGGIVSKAAPKIGAGIGKLAARFAPKIGEKAAGLAGNIAKESIVSTGKSAENIRQQTGSFTPTQSAQAVGQGLQRGVTNLVTGKVGGKVGISLPGRITLGATARQGRKGRVKPQETDDLTYS